MAATMATPRTTSAVVIFMSRSPAALAEMLTAAELDCRAMMGRASTAGARAGRLLLTPGGP